MLLKSIKIHNIRNITQAFLGLHPSFNIIYGLNGSGKTAILEAVHLLSSGRSFRSSNIEQIINFTAADCVVHGEMMLRASPDELISMGISRSRNAKVGSANKINGTKVVSRAQMAQQLPLQIINADSFDIVNASPQSRREFLDWGVFHVEPSFLQYWQRFKRVLQQRNACLKERRAGKVASNAVTAWDVELITTATELDRLRQEYIASYTPLVVEMLQEQMHFSACKLKYIRGWHQEIDLQQVLQQNLDADIAAGFTSRGPHRAELDIVVNGVSAKHFLSRGQMKKTICTMMIARAQLLKQQSGRSCVFLIDDLPAELDSIAGKELITALKTLGVQVIITGIEERKLRDFIGDEEYSMFHVEHGVVS